LANDLATDDLVRSFEEHQEGVIDLALQADADTAAIELLPLDVELEAAKAGKSGWNAESRRALSNRSHRQRNRSRACVHIHQALGNLVQGSVRKLDLPDAW